MGELGAEGAEVSRRSLLKKTAAAGAVAWTAPVIVGSVASPVGAAAQTGQGTGQCFRFMWNTSVFADWMSCVPSKFPADEGLAHQDFDLGQGFGPFNTNQDWANRNCCNDDQNYNTGSNSAEWYQVDDIVGCISVSGNVEGDANEPGVITLDVTCPGCYMSDPQLALVNRDGLDPVDCDKIGGGASSAGGSIFAEQIVFTWDNSSKAPVWLKVWFACGLSPGGSTVPLTQNDCLPGPNCDDSGNGAPCSSITVDF